MIVRALSVFAAACLAAFAMNPKPPTAQPPDAIYLHGTLATMDRSRPFAEALAVRGDRILAVGSDAAIARLAGPHTRTVDLHGAFVMPGFNDAHVHLADAGREMLQLNLTGTTSLADLEQRLRAYAQRQPKGSWIIGDGWDQTLWKPAALPTRADLDAFSAGHPVLLGRVDGHASVANSRALALAGITAQTPNPPGGEIVHDAHGQPSGLLLEGAQDLVRRKLPAPDDAERRRMLQAAFDDAVRHGVTSVQNLAPWPFFLTMEEMEKQGDLPMRVSEWLLFNEPLARLEQMRQHHDPHDPWLHTGMLKAFMDGSLGSHTAALLAPYSDDPTTSGLPQYQQAELNRMAIERARAGFQLGFHAIGDAAVHMALNTFAAVEQAVGNAPMRGMGSMGDMTFPGPRYRIEHAQIIAPGDLNRFRELGVIASVQPGHLLDDMRWAEARLGEQRAAQESYLWRSLLNHGVPLALGTDDPVIPISPFRNLYAAVTRTSIDGRQTYPGARERLNREQALYAYTMGSALAEFEEKSKGSLTPGKYADFVVLSQNLLTCTPQQIVQTQVEMTVVGGEVKYAASTRGH